MMYFILYFLIYIVEILHRITKTIKIEQ